jgi:hypothetical protein
MNNQETVIRHFQDAIEASGNNNKWRFVRLDIIEDAIELLKAQEPRVLTVEEVRDKHIKATPVWKETKSRNKGLYVGWVLAYEVQTGQGITGDCLGMAEPSGRMVWYKLGDYGKTWRCWSAKPSDAERKAVEWND